MGLGVSSQRALCAWEGGGLLTLAGIQALPTLSCHTLRLPLSSLLASPFLPGHSQATRAGAEEEAWLGFP